MASFKHAEIFPIIARLIQTDSKEGTTRFIEHEEIVSLLLSDPAGNALVVEARKNNKLTDDRVVASNMIAWFSQKITQGTSEWAPFLEREKRNSLWAYRESSVLKNAIGDDPDLSAIEGEVRMFIHFRRERKKGLAANKRAAVLKSAGQLACEACGVVPAQRYPGLSADLCEVHHRTPLADSEQEVETHLADLALMCPNCHRAIHRTKPMLSVEAFRAQFCSVPQGDGIM